MKNTTLLAGAFASIAFSAAAEPVQIDWWHAMGGRLGEVVNDIATQFNASQSEYKVIPTYKGNYEETLTATIAAFRGGEQPNFVQVFED